jgi:Tol biopolymer transport system component
MDSPLAPTSIIPFAPDAIWPEGAVVFASDASGTFEIYSVVDGGPPTSLTAGLGSAVEPAVSPDGTQIAFARYNPDDQGNLMIYVMNADGSDPRPVMEEQPKLNWRPTWSPDGSQLLFVSNRDGPNDMNIYRVNVDGSELTNMTESPPGHDIDPDWSPDGSQIVFSSDRDSPTRGLYIMNADGTDVREIPGPECLCAYPRWSPDGSKIAYAEKGRTGSWEIFVMNPDGSDLQQVTENTDTYLAEWLDNEHLLTQGVGWLTEEYELFLNNLENGERTQLTLTPKAEESFPSLMP